MSKWIMATVVAIAIFPKANAQSKLEYDSAIAAITTSVEEAAKLSKCRVTVKVITQKGASYIGYDGRQNKAIHDFSAPVEIGSCSKMYTATAIQQLAEKGKFSLQSKLTKVLPNPELYKGLITIDGKDYMDSVTVLQLLNHSSGFADYFLKPDSLTVAVFNDATLKFTPQQLVRLSKRISQPKFAPGGGFSYSNVNYMLLGLIIEKYSGMPYQKYIQQNILAPLGLKHTTFSSMVTPANHAIPHYKGKPVAIPPTLAGAAGEIRATLDDMTSFVTQWKHGKLFKNAGTMQNILAQHYNSMGMGIKYGMGTISISDKSFGHGGQTFGFNTYMAALPNGTSFALAIDEGTADSWLLAMKFTTLLSQL